MNKPLIYFYICQLERELLDIIPNNRFKELIVSEILTGAIVQLHELDNSTKSDEDTAKGLVSMNIQTFYSQKHLPKVEDKYWNWEDRVQYGWKGRIMPTPDNLIRFRNAVNHTKSSVIEEQMAMMHAVRNYKFKNQKDKSAICRLSRTIACLGFVVLTTVVCIGIYSYAVSHRYQRINASIVFDSWTGKSVDVFQNLENEES